MIIDVSNTIGKHKYKKEIFAEDLLDQMNLNGIDKCVISCHAEYIDNKSISNAISKYPERFIGLYTVNPWNSNSAEELDEAFSTHGFHGLYMNPVRHGYMLCEREVFYPLLDICRKHNKPVWCFGAAEVFSSPVFFDKIASDYPTVNLIMGRMGLQYDNASAVQIAKKHANVYLETSSSMDFNTHRAIKTAGIDKVLLGTGTPDAGYFEFELEKVRIATLRYENGFEKVTGINAMRIFNLGRSST